MYTPQELRRKARIRTLGNDSEVRTSLSNQSVPQTQNVEEEQRGTFGGTLSHIGNDIIYGALKSLEGIVDAGLMISGLFGADIDERVEYDWSADVLGRDELGEGQFENSWGRVAEASSLLKDDGITSQVMEAVGGLLPSIAVGLVGKGVGAVAGATAKVADWASKAATATKVAQGATVVSSAIGKSSESAFESGSEYGQALGYGLLSGVIEGGSELIGGKLFGSASNINDTPIGKLLIKTGGDKYTKGFVGKVAYAGVSEGFEEAVAELLDPFAQLATGLSDEIKIDMQNVGTAFLVGALTGGVLDSIQLSVGALQNASVGGFNYLNVTESLQTIYDTNSAFAYIQGSGKFTQSQVDAASVKNAKVNLNAFESISSSLKKMTEQQRANALEVLNKYTPAIANVFEPNGNLSPDVYDVLGGIVNAKASQNVSANLTHQMGKITSTLVLAKEQRGYDIELSDTSFNEEQRANFAKISNAVNSFGKMSGVELGLAIVKPNEHVNAFIKDGVVYVSEDKLANGEWAKPIAHEVGHFAEGTEEYNQFAKFVMGNDALVNKAITDIVGKPDYNMTEEQIRSVVKRVSEGFVLKDNEAEIYSELIAHITENLLGNEESINRLTRENLPLAKKIWNKIKDLISALKGTNADNDTLQMLKKAESLFEKAIKAVGVEVEKSRTGISRATEQYKKDKKKYESLSEDKKAEWLEENGYKAEDFDKDVLDNGGGSSFQRELQKELSDNTGKSENNEIGIFEKDATDGSKRLKFSLKDSEGNELSPEQQEYFKDSKVRDKDGNLLVVYHGTPKYGFTEFKTELEGAYFTADKMYATEYAKLNKENVYSVYLNIKRPFDTRNAKERKIFEEQFYGQWGNGAPLTDRGLLDWTDGADMYDFIQENGLDYDGIIIDEGGTPDGNGGVRDRGISYVAFERNQIKNTDNKNPTKKQDIRFSLKDGKSRTLTDGQVKKKLADYTKSKVYSKAETERIINSIIDTNLYFDGYNVEISGKTRTQVIDELWQGLNTLEPGKRTGMALKIADFIIDNAVLESVWAEEENQANISKIDILRPYLHSIDLSGIKGEIKNRFDGDNSVYLLWGKRKGESGYTADQIAMDLEEQGVYFDSDNEADIFFELDEEYRKTVKELKKQQTEMLAESLDKETRHDLRQDIAKEILRAFDNNGKKSKLAEIVEFYEKKAKTWKKLYYEERTRNKSINNLLHEVKQLEGLKEYKNATQYHSDQFKGSIEQLAKIEWRGNYNESGTRTIVSKLASWYNDKNNAVVKQRFDAEISEMLSAIANGDGKLTSAELQSLANVVKYFKHFIETETKIFKAGKYVQAEPIVVDYVEKLRENQKINVGFVSRMKDWFNRKTGYMQSFADPMSLARYMDKYEEGGFYTDTMEMFREGAVNAAFLEMSLNKPVEEFFKQNNKYAKELKDRTINYKGQQIPLENAIGLYLTLYREDALLGLARSGFSYVDEGNKRIDFEGFAQDEDLTIDDIKPMAEEIQKALKEQFTATDLEYIALVENAYEECKKLKQKRDETKLGFSNVIDGYYYPIKRAFIAKSVDVDSAFFGNDRVSNLSFNKQTVKGAKQALLIDGVSEVLARHISGIAKYYHLAHVVENYNIIYNMDISGNKNRPVSVATESFNAWDKGNQYYQDLIADIQGVGKKKNVGDDLVGIIRSGYAKYQLGANPKVWVTQFSSFFASFNLLDADSLIGSVKIKGNDVDEYCQLAELRNSENTAALAQGVIEKVGAIGDVLMKPIGITDRFVIKRLFAACQLQVQKDNGLQVGTEENKVKAGKLLTKVILETQQNAMATERSAAMRTSNEFMKSLTMFTSDAMKVVGRVVDAYGEIAVLKARIRAERNPETRAQLEKKLKKANKKARRATTSLVSSAVFMAVVAQAFKHLYGKHEEDEKIAKNMMVDTIGNLIGGLPILKDIYGKVIEGYDFEGFAFASVDDLLSAFSAVVKLTDGDTDSRELTLALRKLLYATGQVAGIPVRNLYNVVFGGIKAVSPETAYKIDDLFYKQSYSADLKKAIEEDDDDMIATIAGLLMNENVGAFKNGDTRKEINRLAGLGLNVLPTSVGDSMTINEETYELSKKDKKAFKTVYSGAIEAVDKLVASKGYQLATDEDKAKAIKYVYRYYYYEAQSKTLGVELDTKLYLFGQVIPIEVMATVLAQVSSIPTGTKNKKSLVQKYVQSAKLSAIQKYMLMGYFGYSNTRGEGSVKSLINSTALTKKQKESLLSKSGY